MLAEAARARSEGAFVIASLRADLKLRPRCRAKHPKGRKPRSACDVGTIIKRSHAGVSVECAQL